MQVVTTVGLDIAKSVFQVHGVDAAGQVVIRRQLKRRYVLAFFEKLPACLVGIEACASSHHWSLPEQRGLHIKSVGHCGKCSSSQTLAGCVMSTKDDDLHFHPWNCRSSHNMTRHPLQDVSRALAHEQPILRAGEE